MAPDSEFEAWLAERADFAATSLPGLTLRPTFDAGWDAAAAARPAPAAAPREATALLRAVQWAYDGECPRCVRPESKGHDPDCDLGSYLAREAARGEGEAR
jgi:hypothetical protein